MKYEPEIIRQYHENGKVYRIIFRLENGVQYEHAIVEYSKNGNKSCELYWVDDKQHREDGPAEIWYYEDGSIRRIEYFHKGIHFDPDCLSFKLPIDTLEKETHVRMMFG